METSRKYNEACNDLQTNKAEKDGFLYRLNTKFCGVVEASGKDKDAFRLVFDDGKFVPLYSRIQSGKAVLQGDNQLKNFVGKTVAVEGDLCANFATRSKPVWFDATEITADESALGWANLTYADWEQVGEALVASGAA